MTPPNRTPQVQRVRAASRVAAMVVMLGAASATGGCGDHIVVLRAAPTGQLQGVPGWVELQLSRPIVDPDAVTPQPQGLEITVEPPVAGDLRFPTPESLVYAFAEPLWPGQAYEVTLGGDLVATDGQTTLGRDFSFTFVTAVNAIKRVYALGSVGMDERVPSPEDFPERGGRVLTNLAPDERFLVELWYPAAVDELESLLGVRAAPLAAAGGGAAQEVATKLVFDGDKVARRIIILPRPAWPAHSSLDVTLRAGLHIALPRAGRERAKSDQVIAASTYGPMAVTRGPECNGCRPPQTLLVEFATPVSCDVVAPFVSLVPPPAMGAAVDTPPATGTLATAGEARGEGTGVGTSAPPGALKCAGQPDNRTVRLEPPAPLSPFTTYTLVVAKGAPDQFGQTLAETFAQRFTTGDATGRVAHQLMFNILERKLSPAHEELVHDAATLEVTAARLSLAEAWAIVAQQGLADQVAWSHLPWWLEGGAAFADDCYWDDEAGTEVCGTSARRAPGETRGDLLLASAATTTTTIAVPAAPVAAAVRGRDDDGATGTKRESEENDERPSEAGMGWVSVPVPLEPYLHGQGGFVMLKSTAMDGAGKPVSQPVLRLLNVTDLGLSAKLSPNQLVVLVARLSDGKPVAGAKVEAYPLTPDLGLADTRPATALSDAQGVAVFPAAAVTRVGTTPDLQAQPLIVVASLGDDQAFMWSSFEAGGQRAESSGPRLVGRAYTERGVYRAGDTVYFRLVARRQIPTGFATPSGESVQVTVRSGEYDWQDEEAEEIFETSLVLNEFGTATGSFVVPAAAPPGPYRLRATIGDESFVEKLLVAEFRRAEMQVTVTADRSDYLQGDTLTARVNADFLFGAPAAGLTLTWSLRRTYGGFVSQRFPDATFAAGDEQTWEDSAHAYSEFLDEGAATLDVHGSYALSRVLKSVGSRGRVESLILAATATDASGQSVTSSTSLRVHPAAHHVGLRTHGYLKDVGKVMSFEVVAVTPEDKPLPHAAINVTTEQEVWYSVQRKGPGGRLYWDYKSETVAAKSVCSGKTNAAGVLSCQVTPARGGSLRLTASSKDAKGRETRASSWFWVTGDPEYYGGRTDGDNQVGIILDGREATALAPARLAITSPFQKALALITVEREDILWRKVMEVGTSATLELPVAASWAPDVWVSATLVRGRVAPADGAAPDPERDKPAYALGYAKLPVRATANTLAVRVRSDRAAYEPGEEVTATVLAKDPSGAPVRAEVNLYAVDEGVLSLTRYETPALVSSLFRERDDAVLALDTRMYVLGRRKYITPLDKGEADGGGGGGDLAAADGELRKDFRPVAAWVGSLETGPDGVATYRFRIPETLTTYRVMAVAVTRGSLFGSGETTFKVNKTLMLRQALPRFVRPNDQLSAGAVVNHLAGTREMVTVRIESLDEQVFEVVGPRLQTKKVDSNETVPFAWQIRVRDTEGSGEIVFAADMGKRHDRVRLSLPVVRLTPRQSLGVAGVVDPAGSFSHTLSLPPGARATRLDVSLSGLPVATLEERLRNLVSYPYGCLEQRTSKVLPLIAARELADKLHFASIPSDTIKAWVEEWIAAVPRFRCGDDGFDYYPGCANGSDPYLTALALDGLVTARRFGYMVPEDVVSRGADYLENRLATMAKDSKSFEHGGAGLASALRLLAELDRSKPSFENALYEGRAQLPLFAKTDLVRAIYRREAKRTSAVTTLLAEVTSRGVGGNGVLKFTADDPERYWWAWDSDLRATALVLRSLLEIVPDDARVPLIVRGLVDLDGEQSTYATQGLTQALLALAAAAAQLESGLKEPVATIKIGDKTVLNGQSVSEAVFTAAVSGQELTEPRFELTLANTGSGPLYFGGFLQYAFPATTRLPAVAEGFKVTRLYTDGNGKPVGDTVKVGDYVLVTLKVEAESAARMVVVDDPLPAGLEPVDTNLDSANREMAALLQKKGKDGSFWRSRYAEVHDDRVEFHFRQLWSGRDLPLKLSYLTRAITPGTYYAPGTHVERLYQPERHGRGEGKTLTVVP